MIESTQNNRVKSWKKLHTKKERIKSNLFLVEGFHLIEEAFKSDWEIKELIIRQGIEASIWCNDIEQTYVSTQVFQHITQTETPQGIVAVVKVRKNTDVIGNAVLLVDAIQDPGNLGTMIRTADAAGFSAVILGDGTVDLYNDKVIRATQGSIFHIPVIERNLLKEIDELRGSGFTVWATTLSNATVYNEVNVDEKVALIVGNEGAGIQDNIIMNADKRVTIPIYGKAESLNVSIAAGVLMYYIKGKLAT